MTQRHMLQPRPHIRIYRADDGTSIPNPLFLRDMLRGGLSVTLEPPAGREPWRRMTAIARWLEHPLCRTYVRDKLLLRMHQPKERT